MATIYCSGKLEKFLGRLDPGTAEEDVLGDWNGHTFHAGGHRCLIFVNSKTCYTLLLTRITKKNLGDLRISVRERFIQQLSYDSRIPESQEIVIRQHMAGMRVCRTNSNRHIAGVLNQRAYVVPLYTESFGPVEGWDDIHINNLLNQRPVAGRFWANNFSMEFFFPIEATQKLLQEVVALGG